MNLLQVDVIDQKILEQNCTNPISKLRKFYYKLLRIYYECKYTYKLTITVSENYFEVGDIFCDENNSRFYVLKTEGNNLTILSMASSSNVIGKICLLYHSFKEI